MISVPLCASILPAALSLLMTEQLPYPILCSFVRSAANIFGLFLPVCVPVCVAVCVCVAGEVNDCISASSSV